MTVVPFRCSDGRFATANAPRPPRFTIDQARELYEAYFVAVCERQGLRPNDARWQLSRPAKTYFDADWRAAVYARQLALYLANTAHSVPQKLLAQVAGITPAAVCLALQAIEDVRDDTSYDRAVDAVAAIVESGL